MTFSIMPAPKLSGVARKVALATIALSGVGWLLVVIGFGIACNNNELLLPQGLVTNVTTGLGGLRNPNAYLYWVVSITGMITVTTAFLHAFLWQPISSVFGAITSFLAAVFLTGIGMILYWNGAVIREKAWESLFEKLFDSFIIEYAGAAVAALFWTLTMILWHFYDHEQLNAIDNDTRFLRGRARQIALPFIILTGIGWLLVVVGFGISVDKDGFDRDDTNAYLFWVVSVAGPVTIIFATLHTVISKYPFSSSFGAVTSFLNVVFVTGLGMIMYNSGVNYRYLDSIGAADLIPDSSKLEFAGSIIATASWTAVLILWHFYDYGAKRRQGYANID